MTPVTTVPSSTPSSGLLNMVSKLPNASDSASGAIESLISFMPNISTAKPTKTPPMSRRLVFFDIIISAMPTSANIGEKFSGLSRLTNTLSLLIPVAAVSHAVSVVPTLLPMITPTVCSSCIIPEFTKPTSITVIADED